MEVTPIVRRNGWRRYGWNHATHMMQVVWIWSFVSQLFDSENKTTASNVTSSLGEINEAIQRYRGTARPLRHDGLVRWFMEYPPPPESVVGKETIPVLLILHYGTGNMRSSSIFGRLLEKDPWLNLAKIHGYLVLAPSGVAPRRWRRGYNTKPVTADWNDYQGGRNNNVADIDDVGFLSALVKWAIEERNGDPTRIYIYGHSNGGMMTERMIIERPNMFAAATAVVANLPEADVPLPSRGTPLFLMSGTEDIIVPYNGGVADVTRGVVRSANATRDFFVAANKAGPEMIETILPDNDPDDNCRVVSQYFPSNTTPVQYYIMDGGGHTFLGKEKEINGRETTLLNAYLDGTVGNACYDADGIQLAWDFMTKFTLR